MNKIDVPSPKRNSPSVVLVGHPFAPIGRGEDVRCTYQSLKKVGAEPRVLDLYALQKPIGPTQADIAENLTDQLGEINIFHLNGDEIPQALAHLKNKQLQGGYNIIYPQWELANYPEVWQPSLDLFDEVWAPTAFVHGALDGVVTKPLVHMPLSCEVRLSSMLGRKNFKIRESAYVFLFFFDLKSYSERKNPQAVLESYRNALQSLNGFDVQLVLKINGGDSSPDQVESLKDIARKLGDKVLVINEVMTDNEIKNLIRCSDCFLSLHRSEGFGRGLAEAMFLGKPVIATAYSGNMDFTSATNAFLVDYKLIAVNAGEYPHHAGQYWADADIEQATSHIVALVKSPAIGYEVGAIASREILKVAGYRSTGVRYIKHLSRIAERVHV